MGSSSFRNANPDRKSPAPTQWRARVRKSCRSSRGYALPACCDYRAPARPLDACRPEKSRRTGGNPWSWYGFGI